MNPQQRQFGAAPRRRGRSPALPTPVRGARRRPEWNEYLTDSDQYRLNQQQQLQRQLQQLSTAHFMSRSPTYASLSDRPRRSPVQERGARSAARSTPRPFTPLSTPSGQSIAGFSVRSSAAKTARRLQFADVPLTPTSPRNRPPRFAAGRSPPMGSVSFYSEDADAEEGTPRRRKLGADEKAGLQNELAVLERMLWDLEAETERLGLQSQTPRGGERALRPNAEDQRDHRPDKANETERYEDEAEEDNEEGDEEGDGKDSLDETARRISFNDDTLDDETADRREEEPRVEEICRRSLSIGLAMTRKMEEMAQQLIEASRSRQDQELKVEVLEQELRATQAKCNYLEAKYDNVASQLEDMREAVTATDDAIHRMAQAFEKTRFHSGRSSSPSTPHRSGPSMNTAPRTPCNRKTPAKSSLKQSSKPSASPTETQRHQHAQRDGVGAENRSPNPHLH